MLTQQEKDNIVVWDGNKKGHYEVYYLKLNHKKSSTAYWIRYTLLSPLAGCGNPIAELWGIFFDSKNPSRNLAFKKTYPADKSKFIKDKFLFQINDAVLTNNSAKGFLEKNGDFLQWDLNWQPNSETFYHAPYSFMYKGKIPKTKVLSPNVDIYFNGEITVNGEKLICENEPGQQTHIWGTKHAEKWTWCHCNDFKEDESAIFEGLTFQIKLGPVVVPPLSLFYLVYQNKKYFFNSLINGIRNKGNFKDDTFTFTAIGKEIILEGKVFASVENFVGVEYTDPDGEHLYCNNTKVANCEIIIFKKNGSGKKEIGKLTSNNTTALEFVSRQKDKRVEVRM